MAEEKKKGLQHPKGAPLHNPGFGVAIIQHTYVKPGKVK
jgi:hypothetical protein